MSVDSQLDEGRSWIERERCVLVGRPYRDDAISASTFSTKERPDWLLVMGHITASEAKLLVVWEISRATRDRPVWAALMAACEEHGVLMVAGGSVHDPNDPDDAFMLDLMAMLAVRESGITSKRVRRLAAARAASGRPHGPIRYGYRVERHPDTGKPVRRVVDEDAAAVVREIAERALAGQSMYRLAKDLNARGIPSPQGKAWNGTNLWKLIVSPTYVGKRIYRGKVIGDGTWPAILTEDEHNRLITIGRDPSRRSSREGTKVKHLLVGIAQGQCGARVKVVWPNKRNQHRRRAYACPEDFCVSRRVDLVDDLINRLMVARLSRPDITELLAELDGDGEAQRAAAEVARLRRQLEEYYAQAGEDVPERERLSPAGLARIEVGLLAKIKRAEQRARPAVLPSVVWEVAGPGAEHRWRALDLLAQRAILKALCQVFIHRGATGAVFDPSLIEVRWLGGRASGAGTGADS